MDEILIDKLIKWVVAFKINLVQPDHLHELANFFKKR